jgi:hypothetical protein
MFHFCKHLVCVPRLAIAVLIQDRAALLLGAQSLCSRDHAVRLARLRGGIGLAS